MHTQRGVCGSERTFCTQHMPACACALNPEPKTCVRVCARVRLCSRHRMAVSVPDAEALSCAHKDTAM